MTDTILPSRRSSFAVNTATQKLFSRGGSSSLWGDGQEGCLPGLSSDLPVTERIGGVGDEREVTPIRSYKEQPLSL
jgi:hypothetical protein